MKKNNLHIFAYLIFVILLLPSIYVNYLTHRSSIIQSIMTTDLNSNNRSTDVLNYLPNYNTDLPNLSFTAIPIKALVSRYFRFQQDFDTALSLLDESKGLNPYIMFTESEKAEVYDQLQVKDSFTYYAKKAFYGLPKNQRHWIQFAKAMNINKDTTLLDQAYFSMLSNSNDPFFTEVYLSTNFSLDRNSAIVSKVALDAKKKFYNDEEVKLIADYVL